MESRSSRRAGALGVEPSSLFPSRSSSPKRSTRSASRACSFIVLLQICLALLCVSFVVQWWHWQPQPLLSRDALLATTPTRDMDHTTDHANLRGRDAAPLLNFGDLEALDGHGANANDGPAPAPAPLGKATQSSPHAVNARSLYRVFVPPNASATAHEIAAWRKRFDPSRHTPDQRKVAAMVAWAWKGYEDKAFGFDYLNVRTMRGDGLPGHDMAITLVDSLDTLFLLGMFEQFDRASDWVATHMKERIYQRGYISLFETTIRNLGGLLSAYYLSGHKHLLQAAQELGDALSPAFRMHAHGMPGKDFDVMTKTARDAASVAEAGSLQLEFKYLAAATGKRKYFDQVEHIMEKLLHEVEEKYHDGLLPVQISQYSGRIVNSKITLGAYGDSYYEYLLKQWLLSGKKDTKYRDAYVRAVAGIRAKLVATSYPNKLVFIGEWVQGQFSPKMDHLVCFVPGMLALGYSHGMPADHLALAKDLAETCYQLYAQMDAKLAPEIAYFNTKGFERDDLDIHPQDAFNLQRPETVESLFILYRVTKDAKYRAYGRVIMDAFETHCRLPEGGYTTISNVHKGPVQPKFRDGMESFFIAETLKYLFLLFSDDETLLPLDEIVFNTEAHPFPMAT